jgi:hypothetical protein
MPDTELEPEPPAELPEPEGPPEPEPEAEEAVLEEALPAEPTDGVIEAAQRSPQAQQGLGTKRALYHRVAHTRRLLRLWHAIGRHVKEPQPRLSRPAAAELLRLLGEVEEALEDFPPPLGEAGQPGYLLVALLQMDNARNRIQNLTDRQRESLARDWESGLRFLSAHREFLRGELRAMRRRGILARYFRAARATINEKPGAALILVAFGFLALALSIWRTLWQN